MLIELESAYGDRIICGKHLTKSKLHNAMCEIFETNDERDFLSVFCAQYGYEELHDTDTVQVDYVLDLDTHQLFKPKYK